jgi:uncharacterized protein (DUF58 family)
MYAAIKNSVLAWLAPPRRPAGGVVVLEQRRIYILPTRQGLVFAAVLLILLTGSINYALGLGFVLTFLLFALALNAMIHTFRNVVGLRVTAGRAQPVFAGDAAHFPVHLDNSGDAERYAIGVFRDKLNPAFADVPARSAATVSASVPAARRGILRPGRLTLFTRYPLGLYRAWSYLDLDLHCLVYPRPAFPALPLPPAAASAGTGSDSGRGQEDFSGLRQYHAGDSPRHIAWKAAARDQGLLTKQFSGRAETQLWLDWTHLPAAMAVEERISHLARWVLDAHAAGRAYGLRLPGKTVALAGGEAQRDACLEALALYEPVMGNGQ